MTSPALPKSFRPRSPSMPDHSSKQQPSSFPKSFKSKTQQQTQTEGQPESFESDENLDRDIERNQAMVTSRMIERLFGTPGNLYQMIPEKVRKGIAIDPILGKLPTESQLRETSEKVTRGYTKPKTELEEKVGETAGDISSFALGSPAKTLLGTTSRLVGIPIAGQLVKEGAEKLGAGEKTKEYAKLGTMLLLDLWGLKRGLGEGGAKQFGYNRLEQAEKAIPKGAMADATVLSKQLARTEEGLRSGITGPHTSEALRAVEEVKNHIKDGKIEASKFPQIRRDINKLIDNMKGFSFTGPPKAIKRASVENLNKVKSEIIRAGNRWGKVNAPEFYENWRQGNEALAVFNKSNELSRFLSKHTKVKNPTLKVMLGMHAYHHPVAGAALKTGKAAVELATRFPTAMVYRFAKSKVLRDLYNSVLKEATKGSAAAVSSLSNKLEKEMEKEGIK